jgi:hypothetical protein
MKINISEEPQATQEVQEARKAICLSCEFFRENVCNSCGCLVERKILELTPNCPEEKW